MIDISRRYFQKMIWTPWEFSTLLMIPERSTFFRNKPRLFAHPSGPKRMDCDKGWPDHVFHSVSEFGESRQVDVS